jgi:hypothetical protein
MQWKKKNKPEIFPRVLPGDSISLLEEPEQIKPMVVRLVRYYLDSYGLTAILMTGEAMDDLGTGYESDYLYEVDKCKWSFSGSSTRLDAGEGYLRLRIDNSPVRKYLAKELEERERYKGKECWGWPDHRSLMIPIPTTLRTTFKWIEVSSFTGGKKFTTIEEIYKSLDCTFSIGGCQCHIPPERLGGIRGLMRRITTSQELRAIDKVIPGLDDDIYTSL